MLNNRGQDVDGQPGRLGQVHSRELNGTIIRLEMNATLRARRSSFAMIAAAL